MYVCIHEYVCTCVCMCVTEQEGSKRIIIHKPHTESTPKTVFCNKLPNSIICDEAMQRYE